MRKIFISAGHSNKAGRDRGASGNGYIEGELSVEFRNKLVDELKQLGINPIVDGDNSILAETINKFKSLTSPDSIVLDIHWNAASAAATGVETLVPGEPSSFERKLAESLSSTVSSILGIPMRGIKGVKTELESHHGRLGWMRLTGENVLLEVCFISNPNDMKKYETNKTILIKQIAKVLFNYIQDKNTSTKFYTVVKGDTLSQIAKHHNLTLSELINLNNIVQSKPLQIGTVLKVSK